uniref:BRX domain-containing protein n=1 Tax=Leersia perrieri TaxID=77586 RepID=A0A0D9X8N9_9ORYZ
MLTCIACSKQLPGGGAPPLREDDDDDSAAVARGAGECATPSTRQAIKALTAQIKDMALKASGAYRHCKPCAGSAAAAASRRQHTYADSEVASGSERFHYAYRRAGSAMSSGDATPSVSARSGFLVDDEEEGEEEETAAGGSEDDEGKEWVAQVEPGVLITFLSLPQGGNDLKRIRFSREMFNKWQAQRWWAENYEKVMELYNVQRFNQQTVPLPNTPKSEDESLKEDRPATPPLNNERLPHTLQRSLTGGRTIGYSQSDSFEHQHNLGNGHRQQHHHHQTGHLHNRSVGLPGEIQRDACQVMVGREPGKDT